MSLEPKPAAASGLLKPWTAGLLAGMRHGFFGREGGVSTGIYASLNAGTGSNDDPANVLGNRRRIAAAFGIDHLAGVHQVHSSTAVFIDAPWQDERPRADALVTTTPHVAISILTADCTPILFADHKAKVIGAAHAGWRGAIGGVIENTVQLMEKHGAQRRHIAAAIGPCIHQSSYEVGPEFEAEFVAADTSFVRFFARGAGDRFHFDLPGFCASRLEAAGVTQIETLPLDTYVESTRLHSHRRSVHEKAGDYGRNCSVILLG
ncbi:MAG: peptidoglycan editing factor PgeF [Hyphomonadaceae bacterium]